MTLSNGKQIGFSNAELIALLGNKLAAAAVKGRTLPLTERVYESLTAAK